MIKFISVVHFSQLNTTHYISDILANVIGNRQPYMKRFVTIPNRVAPKTPIASYCEDLPFVVQGFRGLAVATYFSAAPIIVSAGGDRLSI